MTSEPPMPAGPAGPRSTSPARAFLLYSSLRLLLLVAFAVMLALGLDTLLALGAAVLLSALLSLVVLRPQRDAFTAAALARADARRDAKQARRALLDEDGSEPQ